MVAILSVVALAALALALFLLTRRHLVLCQAEILGVLWRLDEWTHGLQLVKISERSGGRLTRGIVYVALRDLEERGLVESRLEELRPEIGIPRRSYRLRRTR